MTQPAISVVTPTKNRLPMLRETMASVASQTFSAWEHLVVDDGSDDGTAEEVARRSAEDPRVRYVARVGPTSGANVCRNLGIAESRGDLLVFLDSDDLLEPEALGRRVEAMKRNKDLDFVTFQAGVFLKTPGDLQRQFDAELMGDDLLRFLFMECPWQTTAPTWRRAAIERLGGFDVALPSWQDVELHIRALTSGCRYLRRSEVDHHIRWGDDDARVSMQQRRSPRHLEAAVSMLRKIEGMVRDGPGLDWSRQRALCSLYFFVAEHRVRAEGLGPALRTWRVARADGLAPGSLHVAGAALLSLLAAGAPASERLINKWKGWARMRTNPELLPV